MIHGGVVPGKALDLSLLVSVAPPTGKSVGIVFKPHGVEPDISYLLVLVEVDCDWMFVEEYTDLEDCAVPVLHVDTLDFVLVTVEFQHLDGVGVLSTEQKGVAAMTSYAKVGGPDALIDEIKMLLHL